MQEQLRLLVELQAADKIMYDLEQEQEAIPARLAELTVTADKLERTYKEVSEHLESVVSRRTELEKENESIRARIRKAEHRLMGAKNQKEYRAATAEIQEAKDSLKSNDDSLIELMEANETLQKQSELLKTRYEAAADQAAGERDGLEKRALSIQGEVDRLRKNREGLCNDVEPALMRRYDFIRGRRRGIALAEVTDGVCRGCNMELPPQQFNELQRQDRIMECPTCRRIIYWADADKPKEEPEPEQNKKAKPKAKSKTKAVVK